MYESSGSQFFRTQSRPDTSDESRLIMKFLIILGVTELFRSFRLVVDEKTGKEIPKSSRLESLEKFEAKKFALSDAEDNTPGPLNRGGIVHLLLSRTLLAIRQKSRDISICKFGSFKNPFSTITSLSEFYFRFRRFILLVQKMCKNLGYIYGKPNKCHFNVSLLN